MSLKNKNHNFKKYDYFIYIILYPHIRRIIIEPVLKCNSMATVWTHSRNCFCAVFQLHFRNHLTRETINQLIINTLLQLRHLCEP